METIELTMTIPDGVENDPDFQKALEGFIRDWEEDGFEVKREDGGNEIKIYFHRPGPEDYEIVHC